MADGDDDVAEKVSDNFVAAFSAEAVEELPLPASLQWISWESWSNWKEKGNTD